MPNNEGRKISMEQTFWNYLKMGGNKKSSVSKFYWNLDAKHY
jgi:hypothetical protein